MPRPGTCSVTCRKPEATSPWPPISLDRALRLRPGLAEALHHRGIVHTREGQLAEAAARFRDALRNKPDDAEVKTNLALSLLHQGKTGEAVGLFNGVLPLSGRRARRAMAAGTRRLARLQDRHRLAEK